MQKRVGSTASEWQRKRTALKKPAFTLVVMLGLCLPTQAAAQQRASIWDMWDEIVCEFGGGDWVGTRCASSGGAAANLLPAMSNVPGRSGDTLIEVDAHEGAAPGHLTLAYPQYAVTFRTFSHAELAAQTPSLGEAGHSSRVAYVYRTVRDEPRYIGVYNASQTSTYVLASGERTTPVHGEAIPMNLGQPCASFPSCLYVSERDEHWYDGHLGNDAFPPQSNPNWTHAPVDSRCSPYSLDFVPPYVVDGVVFGELRNDLAYLSDANLQALEEIGYDFVSLLSRDFGTDWIENQDLVAVNPQAPRKRLPSGETGNGRNLDGRVSIATPMRVKTDLYYAGLIENQLVVSNPSYDATACTPRQRSGETR